MSNEIKQVDELRIFSSAFSRSAIFDILKYSDFRHIDWIYRTCNKLDKGSVTYSKYLSFLYSEMAKKYRCEYVYKNELIGYLVREYGSQNTVAYNEFKVGRSIVDIALFNGESKAFEIKTELDSPKRLTKQLEDYQLIFDKCYVVIPEEKIDDYANMVGDSIGILSLSYKRGKISILQQRDARQNKSFDVDIAMTCLRCHEYESIVKDYYGEVPNVPDFQMYDYCLSMMRKIPKDQLKKMFLVELKNRRKNQDLKIPPSFLRQISLSMNLKSTEMTRLMEKLETTII